MIHERSRRRPGRSGSRFRPGFASGLGGGLLVLLLGVPAAASEFKPNIIFIMVDDVGYADLGAYGGTYIDTRTLDGMAQAGMRFTRYHSAAPVCSPTRLSLLTGFHPAHFGVRDAYRLSETARGIPASASTLAELLEPEGYHTAHFGKWHLGQPDFGYAPTDHGFDEYAIKLQDGYYDEDFQVVGPSGGPTTVTTTGHGTKIITDYAVDFIERHPDQRIFMNVWYNAGHVPLHPPRPQDRALDPAEEQEWLNAGYPAYPDTEKGNYAALVSEVDFQVGKILAALEQANRESLVIFTSDNGGQNEGGLLSNGPLNGVKRDVFEGGHRVPMLAFWVDPVGTPNSEIPEGRVNDTLFLSTDFFPTFLEMGDVSSGQFPGGLPGQDMRNAFFGADLLENTGTLVWEKKDLDFGVPSGLGQELNRYAFRSDRYKLVRQNDLPHRLYDLAVDPNETRDLTVVDPVGTASAVARLEARYRAWRRNVAPLDLGVTGETLAFRQGCSFLCGSDLMILPYDDRINVNEGDFSFQAGFEPTGLGTAQTVAERIGSWSLRLRADGLLELMVHGPVNFSQTQPMPPTRTILLSDAPLVENVEVDVAFTIFGVRSDQNLARLFVDGVLQTSEGAAAEYGADSQAVRNVYARICALDPTLSCAGDLDCASSGPCSDLNENPIRLGEGVSGTEKFEGILRNPGFYTISLSPVHGHELDFDDDGIWNGLDPCPESAESAANDGDGDGVPDACDNCRQHWNASQSDSDGDGVGNSCDDGDDDADDDDEDNEDDVCPAVQDPGQEDSDGNGVGDACNEHEDLDDDEFADGLDNCPLISNPGQGDTDGDAVGDACDNCLSVSNAGQEDADLDGIGNVCDPIPFPNPRECGDGFDNDGDGLIDFPADPGCAGITGPVERPGCNDGFDNDGDGDVDLADGGCGGLASTLAETGECSDGVDNDSDGDTDYPSDAECESAGSPAENPQCQDGLDNDADGDVDHPADPGCAAPLANLEGPQCDDGLDNDADGLIDFPADAFCPSPLGGREAPECGDGLDNDQDGDIDWPADAACVNATLDKEGRECDDGLDNDGDGGADWDGAGTGPADLHCTGPVDDRETPNGATCGLGLELFLLAPALAALRRRPRSSRDPRCKDSGPG